ncbi:hypothetical protein J3R83DRAFT_11650 [Lanmaoa asiatica]|nr:hypothetical protein J3R83DRAFT_11650 [Lanmaoa asiatica]
MSKPLTAPSQSTWAKGRPPPNSNSSASSSRSQSPAPSHAPTPITASHSRRPSALGQGVPIKEGVSVPRSNVGSVRQGSSITFGSIDDLSPPLPSSTVATPVVKTKSVKSFGSVPATPSTYLNGKPLASLSTTGSSKLSARPVPLTSSNMMSPSTSLATFSSTTSAPTKHVLGKADIAKLFQRSSSAPSQPSSDTSSPSTRPSNLPPHHQPSSSAQLPAQPSQLGVHQSFVPASRAPKAIVIKNEDGMEVNLEALKKHSLQPPIVPIPPPSSFTTSRRTASVRIESEKSKRKRVGQARLEQERRDAEEWAKRKGEERKRMEEEEAKRKEGAAKRKEEEEREKARLWKEEEEMEWLRLEAEERKRKEEQARLEEERKRAEKKREEQDRADRKAEERWQQEALRREAELEAEEAQDVVESPSENSKEPGEGEVIENGEIVERQVNGDSTSKPQKGLKEASRIGTSSPLEIPRRRPGPLDINAAKRDMSALPLSALSPKVQDDGIRNSEGKPIAGGQLFRKYLLNRCQEDFGRGWVAKETTAAAATAKTSDDQAIKAANERKGDESEFFKLLMLAERIMHTRTHKQIESVIQLINEVECMAVLPNYLAMGGDKTITLHSLSDILPSFYFDDVFPELRALQYNHEETSQPHCAQENSSSKITHLEETVQRLHTKLSDSQQLANSLNETVKSLQETVQRLRDELSDSRRAANQEKDALNETIKSLQTNIMRLEETV